jgi:hypothetical protein
MDYNRIGTNPPTNAPTIITFHDTSFLNPDPVCKDGSPLVFDGVAVDPTNEARLVASAGVGNVELIAERIEDAASVFDAVTTTGELVVI